jgi:transposase-like protein
MENIYVANSMYFIQQICKSGYNVKKIARFLQLHTSTLYKIATGYTQKPRSLTFKKLLQMYCQIETEVNSPARNVC